MALVVYGANELYFCYVDEAGCLGCLPVGNKKIQPVFTLCGLIVPESSVSELTKQFLMLKREFFPGEANKLTHDLDLILFEIKGAQDIRTPIRRDRNKRRRSLRILDKVLTLLEDFSCRILPQIYIKKPGVHFNGMCLYTRFVQSICSNFEAYINNEHSIGILIADSRNQHLNTQVSHSIFTQKFKCSGDQYPHIVEMPIYGHSENHAAIQMIDIICSALIFPIAAYAYCDGKIQNEHVHRNYEAIRQCFSQRVKRLSFRHQENGIWKGGINIDDKLGKRNANLFFQDMHQYNNHKQVNR